MARSNPRGKNKQEHARGKAGGRRGRPSLERLRYGKATLRLGAGEEFEQAGGPGGGAGGRRAPPSCEGLRKEKVRLGRGEVEACERPVRGGARRVAPPPRCARHH